MRFVTWLLTYAAGLAVAAWLLDGIWFEGARNGQAELQDKIVPLLVVALIMGLVSTFIEPVIKLISLPFIILTLGLFTLVINAFMLQLTEWIAQPLGLDFSIDAFWWDAVIGAIVITLVSMVLNVLLPDGK